MTTGNGTFDRHPALVEVGSLPHDLQGGFTSQGVEDFGTMNSM